MLVLEKLFPDAHDLVKPNQNLFQKVQLITLKKYLFWLNCTDSQKLR